MSSPSKKVSPNEPSSAGAEAGPPRGPTSWRESANDSDNDSVVSTRPPSYRTHVLAEKDSDEGKFSKDQVDCSACGTQHALSCFPDVSIPNTDHGLRCFGSERVLSLCTHASMTWDQFRREIVDIYPYYSYPTSPNILTITYARDSGLSLRDAVLRHKRNSDCQSWEAAGADLPSGGISFQMHNQMFIQYSSWTIPIPEVYCKEDGTVVEGRGPVSLKSSGNSVPGLKPPDSKAQASKASSSRLVSENLVAAAKGLPILAERLTSLEIYLCPHVDFLSPVLAPCLIGFLVTGFELGNYGGISPSCPECSARFTMYTRKALPHELTEQITLIISRDIGAGASAMEQVWLNATSIKVNKVNEGKKSSVLG